MNSPGTLVARVAPPVTFGRSAARHVFMRNVVAYRRHWIVIVSGFFEPLFYLASVRIGLGALVGDVEGPDGQLVEYATYVAPALLASSAMNGAVFESTINIFFKLRIAKLYDAVLATPAEPMDIALGEIGWSQARAAMYAAAFMVVMAALGLMPSAWGILALPISLLVGLAFAAVGMACATYMRHWNDFDLVQVATMPLFLFSATFYPLEVYPEPVQWLARLSPLYHGTEAIRAATFGTFDATLIVHLGVLVLMGIGGLLVVQRRLEGLVRA